MAIGFEVYTVTKGKLDHYAVVAAPDKDAREAELKVLVKPLGGRVIVKPIKA